MQGPASGCPYPVNVAFALLLVFLAAGLMHAAPALAALLFLAGLGVVSGHPIIPTRGH